MAQVRVLANALIGALDALDGKVDCRFFPGERCRCCAIGVDAFMDELDARGSAS